jgi:hypothetical protein
MCGIRCHNVVHLVLAQQALRIHCCACCREIEKNMHEHASSSESAQQVVPLVVGIALGITLLCCSAGPMRVTPVVVGNVPSTTLHCCRAETIHTQEVALSGLLGLMEIRQVQQSLVRGPQTKERS